jgi:hypothetical protein
MFRYLTLMAILMRFLEEDVDRKVLGCEAGRE